MLIKVDLDWDYYKMSRDRVNVALRCAKFAYFRSKIASQNSNPKRAWKIINNLLGRSCCDTIIIELKINNSMEEMAEAFNEYFVQIGPNLACSLAISDVTFDQFVSPTQSEISRFKLLSVNSFQSKNGPRSFPENYRPISILPAVSKLMERIVYDQQIYFNEHPKLSKQLFGFRNFH